MNSRPASSLRYLLVLVVAMVTVSGCEVAPELVTDDSNGAGVSALEETSEVAAADPAATAASGPATLDQAAIVADYLAEHAPEEVGEPCAPVGSTCAPPVDGIVRECSGFSGACDSTGTKDVVHIDFVCLDEGVRDICTAVVDDVVRTVPCAVPTTGRPCSSGCGSSSCDVFPSQCAERGQLSRTCRSNGVCSADQCTGETVRREVFGSCTRNTDGESCDREPPCSGARVPECRGGSCGCVLP